jgi:hypothetical protein
VDGTTMVDDHDQQVLGQYYVWIIVDDSPGRKRFHVLLVISRGLKYDMITTSMKN